MRLRRQVRTFANVMEGKLRENDGKGGWSECSVEYLFDRLCEEAHELKAEIESNPDRYLRRAYIVREDADVANFAMMIADVIMNEKRPVK